MNKLKKALVMVLALAMVLTCAMVTPVQAAGKLNKKSVSIYETETVSLTVKGVKSVTWKTSDKKIATVDKKGLVKGVKKGTCTVTAKDTKTKAAYSCKVTVKAAKSLGIAAKDISVFTGGETISYPGEEIKGATYVLDGKKLGKKDYSTWTDKDGERVVSYVTLTKKLTDGKHTFAIQKKGYKTVTKSFKFTALKIDGMFPEGEDGEPWVSDGILYVFCTPKLDGKDFVIKVDGTEVKPKDAFLNGDGVFVIWVDDSTESNGDTKEVTVQKYEPVADDSISPNVKDVDGSTMPMDYDKSRSWYVFSGEEVGKSLQDYLDELENEDNWNDEDDWEEPEGYTEKELAEAINDKESEVKKLDIQLRKLKLELETLQDSINDGVVYAKLDGVVKSVGDPDQKQDDGNAFLVVTGDDGLYVSGTISELLLDEVKPGTVVTANSWESGMTFEATVTSVSDYPVSGNSWGEGNPNVSYYQYTAYMEDSSALKNGEYVDLAIQTNQSETGGIYLDKAYVRQEDGKSYVMMADENNQLKKQYVVTGKTVYGTAIEIKSGLTEDDKIAFPYGKTAVEGAAVTEDESIEY